MKRELLLIRLLTKTDIDKKSVEDILSSGINWGIFLEEVFKNKVSNLVLFNLQRHQFVNCIPDYIYCILIPYWKANVLKTNSYFYYIGRVASVLNNANIPYAFVKGFDLIDKLYSKKSQYIRTFNDLDILVAPDDLSQIEQLFLKEGFIFGDYHKLTDEVVPADRYEIIKMKMTSHQIYPLVKKVNYDREGSFSGPIFVDINFTIFEGGKSIPPIATERVLDSAEVRKAFNGVEYRSLDIYYTFVQLVCHLFREANTDIFKEKKSDITLQKFCDIYEFLIWSKDKWEVTKLREIIYSANLHEAFWFVLYFTDILYETTFLSTILNCKTDYIDKYEDYVIYFKERFQLV